MMTGLVICWYMYVSVFSTLICSLSVVVVSDQAVKKQYLTIFLDLPGKLYVRDLSVNVFVKIVDYLFIDQHTVA